MERDRRDRQRGQETPGQRLIRLIDHTVDAHLALDEHRDESSEQHQRAKEKLASTRDEYKRKVLKGDNFDDLRQVLFDDRVASKLEGRRQDRRDERRVRNMMEAVVATQAPEIDYDFQASRGEVPPITLFVRKK